LKIIIIEINQQRKNNYGMVSSYPANPIIPSIKK